ncbi:hypothetical protein AGR7B_Cc40018 [Agrobacterium deltaense RV3]|nr:hypothetical protein AGR7B_Cc40018 [Agrobacterium deltaense RV3]
MAEETSAFATKGIAPNHDNNNSAGINRFKVAFSSIELTFFFTVHDRFYGARNSSATSGSNSDDLPNGLRPLLRIAQPASFQPQARPKPPPSFRESIAHAG